MAKRRTFTAEYKFKVALEAAKGTKTLSALAQEYAQVFTDQLEQAQIRVSMNGRGRALDNVFLERSLERYFQFYNHERLHQSLNYATLVKVHYGA